MKSRQAIACVSVILCLAFTAGQISFVSSGSLPIGYGSVVGILGGYLLVALPEELLFRGIIQNLLTRRLGNEVNLIWDTVFH